MSWQMLHPDSLAWRESKNRQEKLITEEPSCLKQVVFNSGATFIVLQRILTAHSSCQRAALVWITHQHTL